MTNNEYACVLSHIKSLEYAKENDFECIAIFEDDIIFDNDFKTYLEYYLSSLPEDWHIMYLGGQYGRKPSYFDQYFTKQNQTWGAFAYVVHKRAYQNLIDLLNRANKIVDACYIDYQKQYLCIKPVKKLVTHLAGFSEIKQKNVDYKRLE